MNVVFHVYLCSKQVCVLLKADEILKACKPLPKLLSITSAEKLCDRNNNLLWVDYIHTTNITLLNGSIRANAASEPSYKCGTITSLRLFFPKNLKAVVICNACIKETKTKPTKVFLAIAQRSDTSAEAVIKGSPLSFWKLSNLPQSREHLWLWVGSNFPGPWLLT